MADRVPEIKREVRELSLLFELSQLLDSSPDLQAVLEPVQRSLQRHLGLLRVTVTLLHRTTGEIAIESALGLSPRQRARGRYRLGEGITGKVVETGAPIIVPRISQDPSFLNRTGARRARPGAELSFICVPIKVESRVVGALSADCPYAPDAALANEARLLAIVASLIAQAIRLRRQAEGERQRLLAENRRLQEELQGRFRPANLISTSREMQGVYDAIAQVAGSETTVLLRGESGVGKELVAHALHYNSRRAQQPLIKVNCAALPETIIESELFGHEKGAFTGAIAARQGRFELAAGGTIFLDEIGDLSPATQIKLLRVLQEREFERVGGMQTLRADVRVIAATNRDLEGLMATDKFRRDLYYRLNVFPIQIPPLRERKTDIPLLADHFIEKYSALNHKSVKRISTPAIDMLMAYHWPGNVRELENCIERAVLLTTDEVIHSHHLPPTLQTAEASGTVQRGTLAEALERVEREFLIDALKSARGNGARAARALGLTERMMGLRIARYGLNPKKYRS